MCRTKIFVMHTALNAIFYYCFAPKYSKKVLHIYRNLLKQLLTIAKNLYYSNQFNYNRLHLKFIVFVFTLHLMLNETLETITSKIITFFLVLWIYFSYILNHTIRSANHKWEQIQLATLLIGLKSWQVRSRLYVNILYVSTVRTVLTHHSLIFTAD